MKIDLGQVIYHLDGTPGRFKDSATGPERDMTLKDALLFSLNVKLREDTELAPLAFYEMFQLAELIEKGDGEVEITPAQALLLQGRMPKTQPLMVAGRVHKMLNG